MQCALHKIRTNNLQQDPVTFAPSSRTLPSTFEMFKHYTCRGKVKFAFMHNSLAPGRCGYNLNAYLLSASTSCEIALHMRYIPLITIFIILTYCDRTVSWNFNEMSVTAWTESCIFSVYDRFHDVKYAPVNQWPSCTLDCDYIVSHGWDRTHITSQPFNGSFRYESSAGRKPIGFFVRGGWSSHVDHYNDVIMSTMAYQIPSLTIVYSTVNSCTDQRKHQSSAPLAFVRGIHRWPVNSPHKWQVTRKMFPFDDVIMIMLYVASL